MAEFLCQEVYRHDGIAYHSRQRDTLPFIDHADRFVAAVLTPAHPIVVVRHDEASSQVRNPFEQALITPVLEALADPATLGLGPEHDRNFLLASSEFLLDPRRLTVALSRAKRKMVLVASRSVFSLFSSDEETFAHAHMWKDLLHQTCTVKLWEETRDGHRVEVWGNVPGQGRED
jgi:hypothetical protein